MSWDATLSSFQVSVGSPKEHIPGQPVIMLRASVVCGTTRPSTGMLMTRLRGILLRLNLKIHSQVYRRKGSKAACTGALHSGRSRQRVTWKLPAKLLHDDRLESCSDITPGSVLALQSIFSIPYGPLRTEECQE